MVKRRQAGHGRWVALIALGLGSAFLSGCSSAQHAQVAPPDPLRGEMVPPGMPQPTTGPKADSGVTPVPPQTGYAGGVQLTPASMTSSNPAALAGASWQGRQASLEDNSFGPPFLPGNATPGNKTPQVPGFPAPNANPKVEAVPDAKPVAAVAPTNAWQTDTPTIQTTKSVPPASAELLAKQLEERGVLNQKQEVVPEGIHLTCYRSRGPQGGMYVHEVTAADYPAAAQAILQQLDAAR